MEGQRNWLSTRPFSFFTLCLALAAFLGYQVNFPRPPLLHTPAHVCHECYSRISLIGHW